MLFPWPEPGTQGMSLLWAVCMVFSHPALVEATGVGRGQGSHTGASRLEKEYKAGAPQCWH